MPIDGKASSCGFLYVSQATATRMWADVHGCNNQDTSYSTPYGVTCRTYTGCRTGSGKVVYCTHTGGHNFPNLGYEL
eukprot:gene3674-7720_t